MTNALIFTLIVGTLGMAFLFYSCKDFISMIGLAAIVLFSYLYVTNVKTAVGHFTSKAKTNETNIR